MDKRLHIIVFLAVLAVVLTFVRESKSGNDESFSFLPSMKQEITGERLLSMATVTLAELGIKKENIRPMKNRNDVRVLMPQSFDPILFQKAIKDSLDDYNAMVISIENVKDKSLIVQIKSNEVIIKSYIFVKEPIVDGKKGVSPSVPKKQIQ